MLLQQIANGVFLGAVYALFAVGYTLVFGVLDILNLAHAAIFMVAAFITVALAAGGINLAIAFAVGTVVAGLLGVLLDRVAFAPLRKRNAGSLAPLISSIGVSLIFIGVARGICGPDERPFPGHRVRDVPVSRSGPLRSALSTSRSSESRSGSCSR